MNRSVSLLVGSKSKKKWYSWSITRPSSTIKSHLRKFSKLRRKERAIDSRNWRNKMMTTMGSICREIRKTKYLMFHKDRKSHLLPKRKKRLINSKRQMKSLKGFASFAKDQNAQFSARAYAVEHSIINVLKNTINRSKPSPNVYSCSSSAWAMSSGSRRKTMRWSALAVNRKTISSSALFASTMEYMHRMKL